MGGRGGRKQRPGSATQRCGALTLYMPRFRSLDAFFLCSLLPRAFNSSTYYVVRTALAVGQELSHPEGKEQSKSKSKRLAASVPLVAHTTRACICNSPHHPEPHPPHHPHRSGANCNCLLRALSVVYNHPPNESLLPLSTQTGPQRKQQTSHSRGAPS